MSNSNNNNTACVMNKNPEPTLSDVINLITNIPNKDDFAQMQSNLLQLTEENKAKISNVERQVVDVTSSVTQHSSRLAQLEYTIQSLQQNKIRNNICISGILVENGTNIGEKVIKIAEALQVTLRAIDFKAYTVANNKLIIVEFNNYTHKQLLLNKIRIKKSLLIEEVFGGRSNSQIYINEHLTKYFNELFLMARRAKKMGKLSSVQSTGGKIRVRKFADDAPILVTDAIQLQSMIDAETDTNRTNQKQQQPEPSRANTNKNQRNADETKNSGNTNKKRRNQSPTEGNERKHHKRAPKGEASTTKAKGK